MKYAFRIAFCLFALLNPINAQDDNVETLFGNEMDKTGTYGGPILKFSQVDKNWELFFGGKGATVVNKTFGIGGAGYLMLTSRDILDYHPDDDPFYSKTVYLRDLYGGLLFEYINSYDKVIHFTVDLLLGAGLAAYTGPISSNSYNDRWFYEGSAYFVAEPGVNIEVNIIDNIRFNIGLSYRYVQGTSLQNTTDEDLRNVSITIGFKFYDYY